MARLNLKNFFTQLNFLILFFLVGVANATPSHRLPILDVDNINLDGNTISSTNTNGRLDIDLNGSGTLRLVDLTATTVPYLDSNKDLRSSAVTPTELGYLTGVTSAIQTQIDAKVAKSTLTTKGDIYVATGSGVVVRQAVGTDGTFLKADSAQTSGVSWATVSGSVAYRSVTTTDTCTNSDDILTLSGASFTETLFTASGNTGKILRIIHNGNVTGQVYTIDGNSSETINGATTYTLVTKGDSVTIVSDGTNWVIVDRKVQIGAQVRLAGANGMGSTNTEVAKFTTISEQLGAYSNFFTTAQSSTAGDSITITYDGVYAITFFSAKSSAAMDAWIVRNITSAGSLTNSTRLAEGTSGTSALRVLVSYTGRLVAGDVVRFLTSTSGNNGSAAGASITYLGRAD